jgi:peptide-methionine (S)-S-oxide reductase
MNGVARTVVGYTGGSKLDPEYSNIMDSTEAIMVEYDPTVVSYKDILDTVS